LIATTTPTSACCFPISVHAVPSHQTSSLSAPPPPVTALPNVVQAASAQFPVAPSEMYASVPAAAGGSVANVFAPRLQQQHVSLPNVASFRVSRGCRETGDRNGGEDHHLAQGLQRGRLGRARGFRPRTRLIGCMEPEFVTYLPLQPKLSL
jgi:hypothetical protein